jgi:hypothetical protein
MNQNYTEFKFPQIKAHPWNKVFRSKATPEAVDLMSKLLVYTPDRRLTPLQVMCSKTSSKISSKMSSNMARRPPEDVDGMSTAPFI